MPSYKIYTDLDIAGSVTVSKKIIKPPEVLTSPVTVTPTDAGGDNYYLTVSETTTFANPAGTFTDSEELVFAVKSTTPQVLIFGSAYVAASLSSLPEVTSGSNNTDDFRFKYDSASDKWILWHTSQPVAGTPADATRFSTTSNSISLGSKTFTYAASAGLGWAVGSRLRAAESASNYVEGIATAVSSTSTTFTADNFFGSGTHSSWNIAVAGDSALPYKSFSASSVAISSSVADTDIISVSVPANTLRADGDSLALTSLGTYRNNTGANTSYILRLRVGGTVVYNDTTGTLATSAVVRPVALNGKIIRTGATTAEIQLFTVIDALGVATTGRSDLGASPTRLANIIATASVTWNWATAVTFAVSIQLSSSNANHNYTELYYLLVKDAAAPSAPIAQSLAYINVAADQALLVNTNYLATAADLDLTLPASPGTGDVIGLSTGNFQLKVLHGSANQEILNLNTLSDAGSANGILLKPYSCTRLLYHGGDLWVTQERARIVNNWLGTLTIDPTATLQTYTPSAFNGYTIDYGTLTTNINNGDIVTNSFVTDGLLTSTTPVQILVSFGAPTMIKSFDLYLGQGNVAITGTSSFPCDTVNVYSGDTLATLIGTFSTLNTSYNGVSQVFDLVNSSSFSDYIFEFVGAGGIGVLELRLYDKVLLGGEIVAA